MNYIKGPWDTVSDKALDTEGGHSVSDESLERFTEVAHQMDTFQEIAYCHLDAIVKLSADSMAREHAMVAIQCFQKAEVLESINEELVANGHTHLRRARGHNHQVMALAEGQRVLASRGGQATNAR